MDISTACISVLETAPATDKAQKALSVAKSWFADDITFAFSKVAPDRPKRPDKPELLAPNAMPRRRKAGTDTNKVALLHAVAHIELNAIDLAFDMVARFGADMPKDFTEDWMSVGYDEARHFTMLEQRLTELHSFYGALPAHDGLWQSAINTKEDIAARLAVVPMVLEARGLDVTPNMIERFKRFGDTKSAELLKIIYEEEIAHVFAGQKWFNRIAAHRGKDPEQYFQCLVKKYFVGNLKRPFNSEARAKAGMYPTWYEDLADGQ